MMQLLLLLSALLPSLAFAFYKCTDTFCPSPWTKLKPSLDEIDETATVFIGRDRGSGCMCRLAPQWTICFGREVCRSFPKNLNVTTKAMRMKATQMAELKRGDLVNVRHLEALEIDGNYNLTTIQPGTFVNMTRLRNLSISSNANLRTLPSGAFDGLVSLEDLSLVKNGFNSVLDLSPALAAASLPRLVKLELSQNNFLTITDEDFEPMRGSPVRELNLILCQIEHLDPGVFAPLGNLSALRLGENSFNTTTITKVVEAMVETRTPLTLLNLYSVGFRKAPPKRLLEAIAKSNITRLNLARNQFEVITSDSFPLMPRLEILDLREVLALNITNDAFAGLSGLKVLLLSGNKLSTIPEGALLEQLTYLDLQDNSGTPFFPTYFSVYGAKFVNMRNLEGLNLGYNRVNAVYNTTFTGLTKLTVLGLKNASIFYIANGSFSMLANLVVLNLENNHFAKNKGIDPAMFDGLVKLEVLLLGGCGISLIAAKTFRQLKHLRHLGLERNKLVAPPVFGGLPSLRSLDLSQNTLQPWTAPVFSSNPQLRVLVANNNKLTHLTDAMLEDFGNLTALQLQDNPFTCDCSSFDHGRNRSRVLELLGNQSVYCAFPAATTNQTLPKFLATTPTWCQTTSVATKLVVMLPLTLLLITLAVATFLMYYYRWHLRYWVFLTRLYLSRKGKIKPKSEKQGYTNYVYDAFVSYSNEDRNFVIRLVTMLENYPPYLKLCVYERDFQIGSMISESVLESVAQSRRTLLIISDCYAKSQWCRWETQIAEHHRLFFQNETGEYVDDSLVLIKLGPVSESHLTPTLKYLLKTRIYLQWDSDEKKQKVFWERLRGALAPPQELDENTYL